MSIRGEQIKLQCFPTGSQVEKQQNWNFIQKCRLGRQAVLGLEVSRRRIWVIWWYDQNPDEVPDVFGDVEDVPIFVITSY